nr:hypothetical protein [Tanacetum cinerariifolium]
MTTRVNVNIMITQGLILTRRQNLLVGNVAKLVTLKGIAKVLMLTTKLPVSGTKGSVDGSSNSLKGATIHVCKDRCWFKTYESLNDGSILHIGNESTALVHGCGCVDLRFSSGKIVSLFNVLHVPNIKKNLVSSSVLNNYCYKQVIESNKFVFFKHAFMSTSKLNDSILWHASLGHVHFKRMQDMSKDGLGNKKYFVTFIDDASREVIRLPDPKLKTLSERGIECIFVGYPEHSNAFRFYVIGPNDSVSINSIIESRDAIFDENRFSSFPRPSLQIPNGTKNIGSLVVPEEVIKEQTMMRWTLSWAITLKVLADLPLGYKPLSCKWIFKRKLKVDGTIEKFKARLVIYGFKQKLGINYFDTYALVACISTIRLLIAMTLIYNLIIHQMDMKTTFLNGELDEDVYMNQPQGFIMPVNENKEFLSSRFSMKDMREADVILVSTHIDTSKKLMPNNGQAVSQLEYSKVIGCIMYAMTYTRPDIVFVVDKLSMYTSNPGTQHWHAIQGVLNNSKDNSSTSGWVFLLSEGEISWASKKQTYINGSTMEYEFVALAATGKEAEWLRNLILEIPLWSKPITPISILCDSAATLEKAYSQMYNEKSRHLGVRHSMIRELIMNGVISIEFVREVIRLPDPKLKTLSERGIECIFVGYPEHSNAFRFYVIGPNDSVSINSIIESRDAIFDENRFSSFPRPSLQIPNGTKNIGSLVVPEEVIKEMDMKTTFLNGELDEDVYMNQPQGFIMPVNENKEFLSSRFSMKDMREADVILVSTHIDTSKKLMPNNGQAVSQLEYSKVIGCIMYAMTYTRPDIVFVVDKLSMYTSNPGTQHWHAIQGVLKYLKKTIDYKLTYTGYPLVLEVFHAKELYYIEEDSWKFSAGIRSYLKMGLDKLGISELKPTRMSIQLADRSINYPIGAYENLLVKINRFIFQVDFTVLEMDEDELVPSIIGRPFLVTARAVIDNRLKPSMSEPPKLELKDLLEHLEYAFLQGDDQLPVVISSTLSIHEKAKLLEVLRNHEGEIAWSVTKIKGIDSFFFTYKILMKDRVFPYSHSPKDQDNTTFTCPYGTFAYKRMPCGLCNAPTTFQRCMMAIFHELIKDNMEVFMDDFLMFESSFDYCLANLKRCSNDVKPRIKLGEMLFYDALFTFSEECIQAFDKLKQELTQAPVMIKPDWSLPFEIMCDASDYAAGVVLGQRKEKHFQPIHYASKIMNEALENYTTTEKELFAVLFAFDKF